MEIVVNGRNSELSERFKVQVAEKLRRIEKYDQRQHIHRVEVEVSHEKNPRQHNRAARVELTLRSRGPVVRAEAAAVDQHSALDAAVDKLESRLRRAHDRRRVHHGLHALESVAAATSGIPAELVIPEPEPEPGPVPAIAFEGDCPIVVREKTHRTSAMTLDQALHEMELVGHDFYLFLEKDSMTPSVVYRRLGFDYGVIHLDVAEA